MLEKMRLSVHLLVLFLFLEGVALIMGGLFLATTYRLNDRILGLSRGDIPLILTVSEIAKEQLNQTLRINEIFLYGQTGDRENFELANNGFVNAGKRLTNLLVEALHITSKGQENALSSVVKQQFKVAKTVLGEYQKIHGSFEHLSGTIIRGQYEYRFLIRAGIITGNEESTLEEAEAAYIKKLSESISDLDDETKRMENKLREAFHVTKSMVQDLVTLATKERNTALAVFSVAMIIFTAGGLFLTVSIGKTHQKRASQKKNDQRKLTSPFREKADLLGQSAKQIIALVAKIAENNDKEKDGFQPSETALATLTTLASDNVRISTETMLRAHESQQKTQSSDDAIQAFKESSTRSVALANRIQKGLNNLVQAVMQVNLLATGASVEATRNEASQGFVVITNEIKELAQTSIKAIETISELVERDVREITSVHDRVSGVREVLGEMVEIATHLTSDAQRIESASHKQFDLVDTLQKELALIHHGVTNNTQLLHDGYEACQTLRAHASTFIIALDQLVLSFDGRRANERRQEEDKPLETLVQSGTQTKDEKREGEEKG